jgi:hypothetical protein
VTASRRRKSQRCRSGGLAALPGTFDFQLSTTFFCYSHTIVFDTAARISAAVIISAIVFSPLIIHRYGSRLYSPAG